MNPNALLAMAETLESHGCHAPYLLITSFDLFVAFCREFPQAPAAIRDGRLDKKFPVDLLIPNRMEVTKYMTSEDIERLFALTGTVVTEAVA